MGVSASVLISEVSSPTSLKLISAVNVLMVDEVVVVVGISRLSSPSAKIINSKLS